MINTPKLLLIAILTFFFYCSKNKYTINDKLDTEEFLVKERTTPFIRMGTLKLV